MSELTELELRGLHGSCFTVSVRETSCNAVISVKALEFVCSIFLGASIKLVLCDVGCIASVKHCTQEIRKM